VRGKRGAGNGSVSKRARGRQRVEGCVETDLAIVVADREVLRKVDFAHVNGVAVLLGHLQRKQRGVERAEEGGAEKASRGGKSGVMALKKIWVGRGRSSMDEAGSMGAAGGAREGSVREGGWVSWEKKMRRKVRTRTKSDIVVLLHSGRKDEL
jgi:hypothetical protein